MNEASKVTSRVGVASIVLALAVPLLLAAALFVSRTDRALYVTSAAALGTAFVATVLAVVAMRNGKRVGGAARTVGVVATILSVGALGLCAFDVVFWVFVESFKWH